MIFVFYLFVVERPEIVDCQEKVADYAQQQRGSSAGSSVRRMDDSVSDVEDSGVSAEQVREREAFQALFDICVRCS